jgi:protein Mpv17
MCAAHALIQLRHNVTNHLFCCCTAHFAQDNWQGYLQILRESPVFVKACTSGIVYALGDWTAQTTNGVPLADLDRWRVARSAVAGFVGHGPLSHCWYNFCESAFDIIGWNSAWWVLFPKILTGIYQ